MGQILKESVRKCIVDSAIVELLDHGYKESSMRKIANKANMTVGNLYRYFKNKDELMNTITEPVLSRINQIVQKHTNQVINLNDKHFDLSQVPIQNIIYALDDLSNELVSIYYETPKRLNILMMNSIIHENLLKWFTRLIFEYMNVNGYVKDYNQKQCELLSRSFAISLFTGIKECLKENDLEKEELIQVIQIYFRSYMLLIENTMKELED